MDHPPLGRSYLVVVPLYYISCVLILLTGFYGWDSTADIDINPSSMGPIFVVRIGLTPGAQNGLSAIGPQLFGCSTVVWYVMCIDFLNGTLWVKFHGWYWYQSFIDGSNIWGVDRTDPWGPDMDHPPLGRSYLVVWPQYDMSCVLILLTGLYGWDSTADIDINPSSMGIGPQLFGSSAAVWYVMCLDSLNWTLWVRLHGWYWYQSFIDGSNNWGVDRTDPWGPEMDHPPLGRSYLVVVPSYDMSCALISFTGLYG